MNRPLAISDLDAAWKAVNEAYAEFEAMPNSDMIAKADAKEQARQMGLAHVRMWLQWSRQSSSNVGYFERIGVTAYQWPERQYPFTTATKTESPCSDATLPLSEPKPDRERPSQSESWLLPL